MNLTKIHPPQSENSPYMDFWHFINERHLIFVKKEAGLPKPWTEDPILRDWKFCNPFRRNDKQTRWLIDNVIEPHRDDDPALLLFNIFMFRAFNLSDTYEALGWQDDWDGGTAEDILYEHLRHGNNLTSGAYMIRGREGILKYQSIVMTLNDIWESKQSLLGMIEGSSLQNTCNKIVGSGYWGWGPFTAYQVALDLTYTPILANPCDINTWCEFGPGAKKGHDLIFTEKNYLQDAIWLQSMQRHYLKLWVPEMTLQDIEFSLCELGKYTRIKDGGKGKEKYNGSF